MDLQLAGKRALVTGASAAMVNATVGLAKALAGTGVWPLGVRVR